MKQIFCGLLLCLLVSNRAPAADADTEERLSKLTGQLEDIIAAQQTLRQQLDGLAKEIEGLREQQNKPSVPYATQDSVNRLLKGIEDVDRKRLEDYDKIRAELRKLGRTLTETSAAQKSTAPAQKEETHNTAPDKGGYDYIVQKNDTLSIIAQAYREKNIKVTVDQILKANPNLKAEKLKVGQKIFIPAP